MNGRPVIVSGGVDRTVRMWDLATRKQLGDPLTGHDRGVVALAVTQVNGRPIALTAGEDRTVRTWDLLTREQTGDSLVGLEAGVTPGAGRTGRTGP
ncbi:hypothetical protein ACBR40_09870 [Nonomuraea sp. AD125B]|uniref:hypothetical protein n=1 Tax=Nonomuraea sp. AD125B TaxID=3242897 RepID=UPI0035270257